MQVRVQNFTLPEIVSIKICDSLQVRQILTQQVRNGDPPQTLERQRGKDPVRHGEHPGLSRRHSFGIAARRTARNVFMDIISQNKKKENTSPPFYIYNTTGKLFATSFQHRHSHLLKKS